MNEYILYIIMRNDLPSMNVGKAMAQASHASNAFIKEYGKHAAAKQWADSTKQGFGTVIVLTGNKKQLDDVFEMASLPDDVFVNQVIDPSYPYIVSNEIAELINPQHHTVPPINRNDNTVVLHRKELTCIYVFGTKEACKPLIGHLPLHP